MSKKRPVLFVVILITLLVMLLLVISKSVPVEETKKTDPPATATQPHLESESELSRQKQIENKKGYYVGEGK